MGHDAHRECCKNALATFERTNPRCEEHDYTSRADGAFSCALNTTHVELRIEIIKSIEISALNVKVCDLDCIKPCAVLCLAT